MRNISLIFNFTDTSHFQMSLVDDDAAVYLENIVARRDLLMFIFRCKEDELLLTDKRHPWKINSCIISDDEVNFLQ